MTPPEDPIPPPPTERGTESESFELAKEYLLERGLLLETVEANGVEIDTDPNRLTVKERLAKKCPPIWDYAKVILWFPFYNSQGELVSWAARPLPTRPGLKFVTPKGGTGPPYITRAVLEKGNRGPLIFTEGPVKALVLLQAGFCAVGLNGVWGAQERTYDSWYILRKELLELGIRGRKAYLAFDVDTASNPDVRHAEIRLWFLLRAAGTEVYQLTNWDERRGKGIDDFLINQTGVPA